MEKTKKEEAMYCHYSDLPSPMAYVKQCADYDSMGNHGRFPRKKEEKKNMKRLIQKILFWFEMKKPAKKKKTIWDL
jgi:hypothetical protein